MAAPKMGDLPGPQGILGILNIGNNLVEIAALTSLVGSTAAESLALGNKGPAGLVWAMMTVFGSMSVVKLFIDCAREVTKPLANRR